MPGELSATACAVCGGIGSERILSASDPDEISPVPFAIVCCATCGMIYVNPRPAINELGCYYVKGYYDKPGESSGKLGLWIGRAFMLERIIKTTVGHQRGRVLDVGCGEGTFLAAMARRGWEAYGVDTSTEGVSRAIERPGVRAIREPLETCNLPLKSFDLITFWQSIEHMPDPTASLCRAATLLKDKGRVFLSFPNPQSWDFRVFGSRWFHLDPPRHLHYFSLTTMALILRKCGLRVEKISYFSIEYNPFGFVQSVLNCVTIRMNYLYRLLKGTLPPKSRSRRDSALTIVLLPVLLVLSVPYVFLAAIFRSSGCIEVFAAKEIDVKKRGV